MNENELSLVKAAVSEAAKVSNANESTREKHEEDILATVNHAVDVLEGMDFQCIVETVSFQYSTTSPDLVKYPVVLRCQNLAELPKSPNQIVQACVRARIATGSVNYHPDEECYRVQIFVQGRKATLRARHLRDEDPKFQTEEAVLPTALQERVTRSQLSVELKEATGLVRSPPVKNMKIRATHRFSRVRTKPKPAIAKKRAEAGAGAKSGLLSWLSLSYWLGGSEDDDGRVVAEAYKDDQQLFTCAKGRV